MIDSHRIFAVDGPDGAGKTYWIEQRRTDEIYVHMIPFSRRWSVRKSFVGGLFAEFAMGMERWFNSWRARFKARKKNVIMDRCFIAGEVYSSFWDEKFNTRWFSRICRGWNFIIYKPWTVLVFVPRKGVARPRKSYSVEDIEGLKERYILILNKYGYRVVGEMEYDFGVVQTWRM